MDKVKLHKDADKTITYLRDQPTPWNNELIVSAVLRGHSYHHSYETLVESLRTVPFDDLLSALVNGYEVEETPEDKVRTLYENALNAEQKARAREDAANIQFYRGKMAGIPQVLEILNIKIEGVNA